MIEDPTHKTVVSVSAEAAVLSLLHHIGEDVSREGLRDTPKRVVKSWAELYSGYDEERRLDEIITVFTEDCDEMVVLKDIEFYSTCEHHMQPFIGKAHIAYVPANGQVVGISKLARILEVYARRLQIQERIGQQVSRCLEKYLQPKGTAVVLEAKHFCMCSRGVNKQHSTMVTSSLTGVFREGAPRAEFLSLIR